MKVSGQLHAPAALAPGKEPPASIVQETGWAPESFWTLWRRDKIILNLKICYGRMWAGFICLGMGTSEHGFRKMTEQLMVSEEGLSSIKLIS
jgi:hypothetical protein